MQQDNRGLTSQAQAIINKVLEDRNEMIYVINPDGSFIEIKPGCSLFNMQRYQMETYIGDTINGNELY